MEIIENYEVYRTGKLQQYYTLYKFTEVIGECFRTYKRSFVKNLSFEEDKAIKEANRIFASKPKIDFIKRFLDIVEGIPRREYCELEFFGFKWKKTAKGFVVNMGEIDATQCKSVWDIWNRKKTAMKKAGFSVFKGDDNWFLFFRNCTDKEMSERLAVMDATEENIKGEFVGEIKKRDEFNVVFDKMGSCDKMVWNGWCNESKTVHRYTFSIGESKLTWTTQNFMQFEEGKEYKIKATPVSHILSNEARTTKINRVKVV